MMELELVSYNGAAGLAMRILFRYG